MHALWIQVAIVLLLSSFLLWKQYRLDRERRAERARQMTGHGFEAAELKARLDGLRIQLQPSPSQRKHQTPAHGEFATVVRKSLLQLSFFKAFHENQTEGDALPQESGKQFS